MAKKNQLKPSTWTSVTSTRPTGFTTGSRGLAETKGSTKAQNTGNIKSTSIKSSTAKMNSASIKSSGTKKNTGTSSAGYKTAMSKKATPTAVGVPSTRNYASNAGSIKKKKF